MKSKEVRRPGIPRADNEFKEYGLKKTSGLGWDKTKKNTLCLDLFLC